MRKDGGGSPRRLLCVENETTASDVVPRLLFCKGQTPQGNLSFFCFVFFSKKMKWGPGARPLVADRRRRRSVKKTCRWQVFSVGPAVNRRGDGSGRSTRMSNYADLPWGFSLIVAPIKRRTTQRLLPTLRGSFYKLYPSANPSVSSR